MVAVPLVNGIVGVVQRNATAHVGEGIIYDLRRELFDHLQAMSLGFFTNTKTGEIRVTHCQPCRTGIAMIAMPIQRTISPK